MTADADGVEKTRVKTRRDAFNGASLVPGNPGNSGGKPGRSGRTPDAFKEMCRELASREETLAAVDQILRDANHPMFMSALKWATEHGYGKAKESLEMSGPEGAPVEHVWMIGGREIVF
jgi:hypothetical protein